VGSNLIYAGVLSAVSQSMLLIGPIMIKKIL